MACERGSNGTPAASAPATVPSDSMGSPPRDSLTVATRGHTDLVESSAATVSTTQPGIWYTLNDSGHEAILYAFDTTGEARGRWLLRGVRNNDWESMSYGACGTDASPAGDASPRCVYIGDTGDNNADARTRSVYRVHEPAARSGATGSVLATRLRFRYSDGPRDVEAMYVAPDASIYLISKRPAAADGVRPTRPALVFRLPATAWAAGGIQQAELADSLPIVPGSAFARFITDAALSSDAKYLAVRTYTQVYIFATDPATGRAKPGLPPAVCNIASLEETQGEGITWLANSHRLLLTSEGRGSPLRLATCPLPDSTS
jgi:hypothetical protein